MGWNALGYLPSVEVVMTQPDWPGRGHEYMTRLERLAEEHPRLFCALLALYCTGFYIVLAVFVWALARGLEAAWLHI
jgi:hypothetical protein